MKYLILLTLCSVFCFLGCSAKVENDIYIYGTKEFDDKTEKLNITTEQAGDIAYEYYLTTISPRSKGPLFLNIIYGDYYIFRTAPSNLKVEYNMTGIWVDGVTGEARYVKTNKWVDSELIPFPGVQFLVGIKRRPDAKTQTLILKYAKEGDYANLVKIVTDGVSVNFKGPEGDTPLLAALGPRESVKDKGLVLPVDKKVLDWLFRLIDDPTVFRTRLAGLLNQEWYRYPRSNAMDIYGYLPTDKDKNEVKDFIKKAVEDRVNTVKFLLEKGADITVKDADGNTPLQRAKANGHTDLLPFLKS